MITGLCIDEEVENEGLGVSDGLISTLVQYNSCLQLVNRLSFHSLMAMKRIRADEGGMGMEGGVARVGGRTRSPHRRAVAQRVTPLHVRLALL